MTALLHVQLPHKVWKQRANSAPLLLQGEGNREWGKWETVPNIQYRHSYNLKRNCTSAFKHKTSTTRNKNRTYPSPKHSHLSHLKSYSEQKWCSKKSLLTDTVPEVLRRCLTVVIPPHLTPNHVPHRECPKYLAAFPWLVSKCWGPSALLCKMFPPEDHSLLQTELLRSLRTLELPLKLTGKGNKAFRFAKQNRKINPSETVKNF